MRLHARVTCVVLLWLAAMAPAAEPDAARLYLRLRATPQLEAFLRAFPKGADLHSHLTGAIPPETYVDILRRRGFCFDRANLLLIQPSGPGVACATGQAPAAEALVPGREDWKRMADAMSVRGVREGSPDGAERFFRAFRVRWAAPGEALADLIENVVVRAAAQNISYLELMLFPFAQAKSSSVAALLRTEDDMDGWLRTLRESELFQHYVREGREALRAADEEVRRRRPMEAAQVERRYIVTPSRTREPANVFAALTAAAELVTREPLVVALNLAAPEHYPVALRDFRLHMRMLDFLSARYPALRVTLHAGELTPAVLGASDGAIPEDATFHISESVWVGRAQRIGHGSAIRYEKNRDELLRAMRERGILVEISLTSQAQILGLRNGAHPFSTYRAAGVPVAINTDDEGILETDLSREFLRAARGFRLSYLDLKELARNSLEFAFLPGQSLFRTRAYRDWVPACSPREPRTGELEKLEWPEYRERLPESCRVFLDNNPKASVQMRLEYQLVRFESLESLTAFRRN